MGCSEPATESAVFPEEEEAGGCEEEEGSGFSASETGCSAGTG